jgi:transposase
MGGRLLGDPFFLPGYDLGKQCPADGSLDFVGLENYETLRWDRLEHILLVRAAYKTPAPTSPDCPECHSAFTITSDTLAVWDIPRGGSQVLVQLTVPRVVCRKCGPQTVLIPHVDVNCLMTDRLKTYIAMSAASIMTFKQIASATGPSEESVSNVFLKEFGEFEGKRVKELPRVLLIDEVYVGSKCFTVLVDGETLQAFDILREYRGADVLRQLKEAPNPEGVEFWSQDFTLWSADIASKRLRRRMNSRALNAEPADDGSLPFDAEPTSRADEEREEEHYRLTKKELQNILKNAKVVGDHFHFKQAIRASMDKVRRAVQKALLEQYLDMAFKSFSECDRTSPEWPKLEEKARFEAGARAKRRENELTNHRKSLCTRPENLKMDQDRKWVEQMCDEHPLLRSGHEAMIRGFNIFPLKPPLGRTRKSREAAMELRLAQLMTEEEAGRRLDEWASFVREEGLEAFFARPLRLICNWRPELIRIGTTPYSNAGAESKNRYLRMLNAITRGLKFETLRARVLWADANPAHDRWPTFCDGETGEITAERFIQLADAFLERNNQPEPAGD